MNLTTT